MNEARQTQGIVPCDSIEPVQLNNERRTLSKVPEQSAFATFNNWARHEARHLCERGSCATGTCRGRVDVSDWHLVEESEEEFTCEFSAEFFCRCQ
jgi:hypothetical protein